MTTLRSTILSSAVALLTFVASPNARSGLDLTPAVNEYVALGMKHRQVIFNYDKQKIEFEPPSDWKIDGSPNQVRLTPPQKRFAEALIAATPQAKPQSLDENGLKLLAQQAIAGLPVGSQFAKIDEELPNSVLIGGNPSFEITVSYQSMGEKFRRSVWVVNLPDTQLIFRLTAKQDNFGTLHREFKTSIFSWHVIDQESAATKEVAAQ